MKLYQEIKSKKSWAIRLIKENSFVKLVAVDSYTGRIIAYLIHFFPTGEAKRT